MTTETCDYLILDAPFPPSINALKTIHKRGKLSIIGKSKEYINYQKNVFNPWWLSVRAKGKIDLGQEVIFWTVTCPKRAGSDTDNFHKCFLDCLESAGAFVNDNVVVSTRNERGPRIKGGLLRVFIANERHRDALYHDYEREWQNDYHPRRDGPILKQPQNLRIRRVTMIES